MMTKILALTALAASFLSLPLQAQAQHVSNPKASVVDAASRTAVLQTTNNPLLHRAVAELPSCVSLPFVAPPPGPMQIPSHYFNGSYGAINPAEVAAARIYNSFDERVTAGMNQYVATGNQAEAACALAQLDAWARTKQLMDYNAKTDSQAWFTAGWALCSAAISESVLRQDSALDPQQQARVVAWLRSAAHTLLSWEKTDARGNNGNNLHYWRALAAIATGVLADDNDLFRFGVDTYKQAIDEIDANGAFPLEMKRHENSIHYQAFALQPLVMIAEFATRQNVDLYAVSAHGRAIRDAIIFLGRAMADPALVRPYTTDPQKLHFTPADIAELNFYIARFGSAGLSSSITDRLSEPASDKWIGGNTTVLARLGPSLRPN